MSYSRSLYHIVFRTKQSQKCISETYERDLYAYILGFCNNLNCKLYRIGGMPDHIHLLVAISPQIALASFMQQLKSTTSKWLKENVKFPLFKGWGDGYAAFTYSFDDIETVKNYIINQKQHHKVVTFVEEYRNYIETNRYEIDDTYFLKD